MYSALRFRNSVPDVFNGLSLIFVLKRVVDNYYLGVYRPIPVTSFFSNKANHDYGKRGGTTHACNTPGVSLVVCLVSCRLTGEELCRVTTKKKNVVDPQSTFRQLN